MKSSFKALLPVAALVTVFSSCQKPADNVTPVHPTINLSAGNVQLNQRLGAVVNGSNSSSVVRWSVYPPANNFVSGAAAGKSVMLFSSPGTYTVTASFFTDSSATTAFDSTSTTVNVSDTLYHDTASCNAIMVTPFPTGDALTLTPITYGDSGIVVFTVRTQSLYTDMASVGFTTVNSGPSAFEYAFSNVNEYPCQSGYNTAGPATAYIALNWLANGTFPLTFTFNGVTYTGSITVSDATFTFNWSYTSGVVISPLQINRR